MIIQGDICVCDVCGMRWVLDAGEPLRKRCKNRHCRSLRWNTDGKDRRFLSTTGERMVVDKDTKGLSNHLNLEKS